MSAAEQVGQAGALAAPPAVGAVFAGMSPFAAGPPTAPDAPESAPEAPKSNVARLPVGRKRGRKPGQSPQHAVDASTLSLADDPPPQHQHPAQGKGKFDAVFQQLGPGKCLRCRPEDARMVANDLRHWLKVRGRTSVSVVYRRSSGADRQGRVWIVPKLSGSTEAAMRK